METSEMLSLMGNFNEADHALFKRNTRIRVLAKGELLYEPGKAAAGFWLIINGAVYQYNYQDKIDETVIDLHIAGEWFRPGNPAKVYHDTQILELELTSLHWLIQISPAFLQFGNMLTHINGRLQFFDKRLSPVQKYQFIINNRPSLLQQFPLKMIASYLKISPETLSRVRESLMHIKNAS